MSVIDDEEKQQQSEYILPQDEIYALAIDKNAHHWKFLLEDIIKNNNLDPFDIDISILTKKYLETISDMKNLDFSISGKLLTIAVFLLNKKAQYLVEHDISGIDETLQSLQEHEEEGFDEELDVLENIDDKMDAYIKRKQKGDYQLKVRNPIARKRKVSLNDLILTLEKTFKQSNLRRKNLLLRNTDVDYTGPNYLDNKKKDLKTVIEELFETLLNEFKSKKAHVVFHTHLLTNKESKMSILDKFIPLLHLHNQEKITLKQKSHLTDIEIHKEG